MVAKKKDKVLAKKLKALMLPTNITLQPTAYEEERFWGVRTHVPITEDAQPVMACCNEHRETCIRVAVGRKKTAYIPMEASGLHVVRCSHDQFAAAGWSGLVEYTPQVAAQLYLNSRAASYYISEEARTLLEEISKSGAIKSITKENDMSTATNASKTSKDVAAAKAAAAKKPAKAAAAKPATKAAPAKPAAKTAQKSASKSSKAEKPTGHSSPYAGMKIKALTTETGAREGTVRHALRKAVLKATDVDTLFTKTVMVDGEEHPITGTVLSNMINLGMIKVS